MDATSVFGKGGPKPVLVVLTGPQVGHRIVLEEPAVIGRDPMADLALSDEEVDWHHARVERAAEHGWRIVDLTGEGRTHINGAPVERAPLSLDDQIIVGQTVVRYEMHDPVERAYDEAVLERLYTDELTGLLARRKFDIDLRSTVAAAARAGGSVALIILDVDRLKPINDEHGHLIGAAVIAEVGRRIGRTVGTRGLACRLGGDEFGVALPGADAEEAMGCAARLRVAVSERPVVVEEHAFDVAASIGVALYPEDATAPLELLRLADEALYRAKRMGGDACLRWTPREP